MMNQNQLYTVWGRKLDVQKVLPEYPRMQLRRESILNLNGYWDYAFTLLSQKVQPEKWDGKILVPFSPETALSEVGRQLQPEEYLWYHRTFSAEELQIGETERLLLHFGAVDQACAVFVNGKPVGKHVGGYLPFSVDITRAVMNQKNEMIDLAVRVRDVSDTSCHSRGKQKLRRGGMYYTAQSGIWQTVWLEKVPADYIQALHYRPDVKNGSITIRVSDAFSKHEKNKEKADGCRHTKSRGTAESAESVNCVEKKRAVKIEIFSPGIFETDAELAGDSEQPCVIAEGVVESEIVVKLPEACPWNCETPWLYPVRICMGEDVVRSYFALREIEIRPDAEQIPRIYLNGKELFLKGVLDQGYWPESLMTPPADEAILFDLTEMKRFGFNMIRKHAKIEPDRFYYHCDRLGLLVWQDLVNGGSPYKDWFVTYAATGLSWAHAHVRDTHSRLLSRENAHGRAEFLAEMRETTEAMGTHPSIIGWTIFNEAWGQFETEKCTSLLRALDETRLIDAASGWFDQGCGDVRSVHYYFLTFRMKAEKQRAFILSEFGGLPRYIEGHSFGTKIYGYGKCYETEEELTEAYGALTGRMEAYIPQGLTATVYTQWTDIEDEVNGIYTWDRAVKKMGLFGDDCAGTFPEVDQESIDGNSKLAF